MSADENPYEPTNCRTCDEPVRVVPMTDHRASGSYERLVRRCDNPDCRTNNGTARMSDRV